MTSERKPRIALIGAGDVWNPSFSSGRPYSLGKALSDAGIEVVGVNALSSRPIRKLLLGLTEARWRMRGWREPPTSRIRVARDLGIEFTRAKDRIVERKLQGLKLDGVIQMPSDISLGIEAPLVTYEDMTVRQAFDSGYDAWQLPAEDLKWRIDRQRAVYERAVMCTTEASWAAASIHSDYGISEEKIGVVGVGRNHDLSWVARSWVPPRFLFIASDWERKNGEMVLSAFKRLLEDIPEAHLDLVGHVPDIEEANIASHGYLSLADPSQRARLNPLFERATCLLIPSLHEPLGISIVEAGASGVPSIGSIHGGSREAIGPGGVVIDPRDLDQLTNAMLRFSDPDVAREAGMRAWERSKLYTWTAVADRLLQALNIRERQNSTFSRL